LLGNRRTVVKLEFRNVKDLQLVKRRLLPAAIRNREHKNAQDVYNDGIAYEETDNGRGKVMKFVNVLDYIEDVREHDVPYYVRCAIDLGYRVGLWYDCIPDLESDSMVIKPHENTLKARAEPIVLAFDIETHKAPLKFPDSKVDPIIMISYMIDGQGYLITNREIVSKDIEDFEYTPKPEYPGPFVIFNENSEKELLALFFSHVKKARPSIFVTYNGDFFDWPYVEARAGLHGMDMYKEIGVKVDSQGTYCCSYGIHMDCFEWVKRDSYLPQGSQGLKAVTSAKLGYDPKELDPEDMVQFAQEQPDILAQYSVSDAVATYYLYYKYVHPFIFSLCNIIPGCGDDVLRKGSGTLCEMLLMVMAYEANVLMPNKYVEKSGKTFEGHLLNAETYVGGHVEALEAGVFRADIPTRFLVDKDTVKGLIDNIDLVMEFFLEHEAKREKKDVLNYEDVKEAILSSLEDLHDTPNRLEKPLIYHLDVAAMYPNIILTNRLQPDALISDSNCASCDYNTPESDCKRRMEWSYRAEFYAAKKNEVAMLRGILERELHDPKPDWNGKIPENAPKRTWQELTKAEQNKALSAKVAIYSNKVYNKKFENKIVTKESIVCQRENGFYVDTVKGFRDRRYEYKGEHKKWKKALDDALASGDAVQVNYCKKMVVLYDSLQLAHKCILNSFYGYVMRKGSRWYSMEMAGIVCLTGARIIQLARQMVEKLGRPLELDTDGIWCILPATFPENFVFKFKDGKAGHFSYPCSMLNQLVHRDFTNHQYQTWDATTSSWVKTAENSIFFEVDGPYRCMILPASTEEGKLLKKRYAVIDDDGTLAELKGFEVKRRGELKLIKIFQSEIFKVFLKGDSLETCYAAVAETANRWLDVLHTKGEKLTDDELLDLISENRNMSKSLEEYGAQKSTSITSAKRLAQMLGDDMVKDKGLNCRFIVSQKPAGLPVSERAVPVVVFQMDPEVRRQFLCTWLKDGSIKSIDIRSIIDWDYYLERFGSVIQKLITIPAAMQKVSNPVPRVKHPDWLLKSISRLEDKNKQQTLESMWKGKLKSKASQEIPLLETQNPDEAQDSILVDLPEAPEIVAQVEREEPEEVPEPTEDYQGWLVAQKTKWKLARLERQRFVQEHGNISSRKVGRGTNFGGMEGYLARQAEKLIKLPWEVLQVVETDTLGEFKVWALVDGDLHAIKLIIPRTFYVNARIPQSQPEMSWFKMEPTRKALPRSHQALHLYEVTMPESKYRDAARKISNFISHPSIEGAYETQVPLEFRALLQLGCISSVGKLRQRDYYKNGIDGGFQLNDLHRGTGMNDVAAKNFAKNSWIHAPGDNLHFVYIYHVAHDHDRGMYGIFSTVSNKVNVILIDKTNSLPNLGRLWQTGFDLLNPSEEMTPFFKYHAEVETSVKVVGTDRDALKEVAKVMTAYKSAKHGPTCVLIQTPRNLKHIVDNVVVLHEFPHTKIPAQHQQLPALDWQRLAAKNMIGQAFNVDQWLRQRLNMAETADVPFCNIEDDYSMFLSDVLFARRLKRKGMLLWYSPSDRPDLGGREMDENHCMVEHILNPEVNHPGMYTKSAVYLDVSHLVLTTILKSEFINELEGSIGSLEVAPSLGGLAAAGHELVLTRGVLSVDQQALSDYHFQVLKEMVLGWAVESLQKGVDLYETLLEHFLRWLTNPTSKLYDPALNTYIHGMMKKVFVQLLGELKKLGGSIIYANFNHIVFCTPKSTQETAKNFVDFLIKDVCAKDLFRVLKLEPRAWYNSLLWMDLVDYAGVVIKDGKPMWHSLWHVKEYLPLKIQSQFDDILRFYVEQVYKSKDSWKHPEEDGADMMEYELGPGERAREEELIRSLKRLGEPEETSLDPETKGKREIIDSSVQPEMFSLVNNMIQTVNLARPTSDEEATLLEFPELTGSHLKMDNAALEFIKMVCHVLGLDVSIESVVLVLKRNLLRMLQVSDNGDLAEFKDPCEIVKLSDVICDYCMHTCDFDLCRDASLLDKWECEQCQQPYQVHVIEEALLEQARKHLLAWQLQDLCRCGEQFTGRLDRNQVVRKLKVYGNIARKQKLALLGEYVAWTSSRV
jgi:DNA polymerase epsilon subunit 1